MSQFDNMRTVLKESILKDFEPLRRFKVFKKIYDGRFKHFEKMYKLLGLIVQKQYKKGGFKSIESGSPNFKNITGNIFTKGGRFKPGGLNALGRANHPQFRGVYSKILPQHFKILITKMHRALKTEPTSSDLKKYVSSYYNYYMPTQQVIKDMKRKKIFNLQKSDTLRLRMRKLQNAAKMRGIRITKNVNGKRVYKTEKELKATNLKKRGLSN